MGARAKVFLVDYSKMWEAKRKRKKSQEPHVGFSNAMKIRFKGVPLRVFVHRVFLAIDADAELLMLKSLASTEISHLFASLNSCLRIKIAASYDRFDHVIIMAFRARVN